MKRETVLAIVAGVIFVGGLSMLYYARQYMARLDREALEQVAGQTIELPTDPNFNPRANDSLAFEADSLLIAADGSELASSIQYDGRGSIRFDARENSELTEVYITPTESIVCSENGCIGVPPDETEEESLLNIESFVFAETDLYELGQGLVKTGAQQCSSGTCDVWAAPAPSDVEAPVILIDQATRNIIRISGTYRGESIDINYVYKDKDDIKIYLPLNVERSTN